MGGAHGGEFLLLPRDEAGGAGGGIGAGGQASEDGVDRERVERLHGLGFVAEYGVDPEAAGVGILGGEATGADSGIDDRLGALAGLRRERRLQILYFGFQRGDGAGDLSDVVVFLSGGGFDEGEGAQSGEEGVHGLRGGRGVNACAAKRRGESKGKV